MPEYKSKYTGAEIDALLDKVDGRTSTPAPAEDKLITSGGVYTGLAGKTDKVKSPTAGNLAKLKADGSLEDSGKKPSDFVEKEAGKGLSTNDYTNEDKTKLGALPTNADLQTALGNKEDKSNKVISFSNPTNEQYPSAKLVSDSLDKVKADVSSLLTKAGIAGGIADTISAGTAQEFLQRQSGGDGVNCIRRIKGCTKAINQLAIPYSGTSTRGGITISGDGSGRVTIVANNATNFNQTNFQVKDVVVGHKYYCRGWKDGLGFEIYNSIVFPGSAGRGPWILTAQSSAATLGINLYAPATLANGTYEVYPEFIDLTLWFGAGNEPSTPAEFDALYPEFIAPTSVLKSNDAAALLTDGRNQWDGNVIARDKVLIASNGVLYDNPGRSVTGWIPVIAGQVYYFTGAFGINGATAGICFYDSQKNFLSGITTPENNEGFTRTIPAGAAFMRASYLSASEGTACINLSDASFNGTYEPYWQRVLALRLSELTGIPEGGTEADRVTMFPNGLGGAGSAFDSIFVENGVTKARRTMARVDLGTLDWTYDNTHLYYYSNAIASIGGKNATSMSEKANIISSIAITLPFSILSPGTMAAIAFTSDGYIAVRDGNTYASAAAFKAAMSGVMLEYELATPIVYTDLQYADGTPFTMPATILVDNYGTERIQAPEGATTPSAPFCCDSNYSISIANLVKKLNTL